jgi:glycosyltransferase involved in cell wall biosynthesis
MRRRVLYLAWAPFFSGAERALLLTIRHVDPARWEPVALVGTDGELLAQLRAAGVHAEHVPIKHLDARHPLQWLASVASVVNACRRWQPALIHANDMPSYQPGGFAGRFMRIPAVTHIRFPDEDSGYRWFLRPAFDRALFVSAYLRSHGEHVSPTLFEKRSVVLYDGVAVPDKVGREQRSSLKRELGLPEHVPTVALTGQIAEVKGIWEFVEAARLLTGSGCPCAFAVLGDDMKGHGALRAAMQERVAALGMSAGFHFLGFRPDATRILPAFDIVAVPSHVEPLGNATLEAMAAGLPVVGSQTGGIPEMVIDGETGVLVPPGDAAALAGAIGRLARSADERERLGQAARERASAVFSLDAHSRALSAIYDDVLAARSGNGLERPA